MRSVERGVLYIAMGERLRQEANLSAHSIKESNDLHITLVTDEEVSLKYIDDIIITDTPKYHFADKPLHMDELPYEKTLYLDTDIYVCSDISELFEMLEHFDLAAAHNPNRSRWAGSYDVDIPKAFPEYNTGVIGFKHNERVHSFLEKWKENYLQDSKQDWIEDQPTFRKCLYEHELRFATLPPEYNCVFRYPGHVVEKVKVFHGRLMDIDTKGGKKHNYNNIEEVTKKINRPEGHRLYWGSHKLKVKQSPFDPLWSRALHSIQNEGYRHTIKRGITRFQQKLQTLLS